jgi:hypothetical protein
MDLTQSKLTKAEWVTMEIPVSDAEKEVLQLLLDGYHDINIRRNATPTLFSVSKIESTPAMQDHLYEQYLKPQMDRLAIRPSESKKKKEPPIKTRDLIRMKSMDAKIDQHKSQIFEFVVLDFCRLLLESNKSTTPFYVYTLMHLQRAHIANVHPSLFPFVERVLALTPVKVAHFLHTAHECIEKNPHLFKYADRTLFDHQKSLFRLFRSAQEAKLVFYTAPTGTGKTLSPLGLSEGYRVLFICAARHVGLALAKAAVTMQKRVAVAFGCETASDIRLHYFAASEYSRNKRSGGIGKVDNSVGDKVQIMICDVKSYLVAMHYMLAFSLDEPRDADLITYWDEPTITMDYAEHPLHAQIQRNWQENQISKMVLSCATLPLAKELGNVIADFVSKFPEATHHTISSFESSKSISLWDKNGQVVLPHRLFQAEELQRSVQHCLEHRELLRYLDLAEVVRYVEHQQPLLEKNDNALHVDQYFASGLADVTMHSLKEYYLVLLQRQVVASAVAAPLKRQPSLTTDGGGAGTLLTTRDAHTLTDGPTIFLAEDVEKVGRFLIQQSNIPVHVFQQVTEKIAQNSHVQRQMDELQHVIEDREAAENKTVDAATDDKKKNKKDRESTEMTRLTDRLEQMRAQIRNVCLDNAYIPNTVPHQRLWRLHQSPVANAFVPSVDPGSVREIMALDVTDAMKLLLLMGVGMFVTDFHPKYVEVMKRLAADQRLFLILASSDYIYGTNYQFCHGFVGKDLGGMTFQKTIQAMGRIGRNHIQQEYTVRFRDDDMVTQLFLPSHNPEADTMNRLFVTTT